MPYYNNPNDYQFYQPNQPYQQYPPYYQNNQPYPQTPPPHYPREVEQPPKRKSGRDITAIILIVFAFLSFGAGLGLFITCLCIGELFYDEFLFPGLACSFFGLLLIFIALLLKKNYGTAFAMISLSVLITTWAFLEGIYISNVMYNYSSSRYVSFSGIYYNCNCEYPWASHGSDWSYISIDSNPYDYDDDEYPKLANEYLTVADNAIKRINKKLDLPDSLYEEIRSTSPIMGRQTMKFTSKGVEVTWSFHPDSGLEVMYKEIIN